MSAEQEAWKGFCKILPGKVQELRKTAEFIGYYNHLDDRPLGFNIFCPY